MPLWELVKMSTYACCFCVWSGLEVRRAGSQGGKIDMKWRRARTK